LYSATIHTLLSVAPNRPDPCPDQISARSSVGVSSSQTSSVHPRPTAVRDRNVALREISASQAAAATLPNLTGYCCQVGHLVPRDHLRQQTLRGGHRSHHCRLPARS
jgi:hypothetical protein